MITGPQLSPGTLAACAAAGLLIALLFAAGVFALAEFVAHRWNPFA